MKSVARFKLRVSRSGKTVATCPDLGIAVKSEGNVFELAAAMLEAVRALKEDVERRGAMVDFLLEHDLPGFPDEVVLDVAEPARGAGAV